MSSYRDIVLRDKAISLWRLGESAGATTAADENELFPMVVTGSPNFGQVSPYTRDSVTFAEFDGATEYLSYAYPYVMALDPRLRPGTTGALSLEFWFKTTSAGVTGAIFGAGKGTFAGDRGWEVKHLNGVLSFVTQNSPGDKTVSTIGAALNNGAYHHFAVTVERGTVDTIKLYVDGILNNSSTYGPGKSLNPGISNKLTIGASAHTGNKFTGTIGDVAWYPYALSAKQVASHYTARDLTNYDILLRDRSPEFITLLDIDVEEDITEGWTQTATPSKKAPTRIGGQSFKSSLISDTVAPVLANPSDGRNRIAILRVAIQSGQTVVSATWGGVAMTLQDSYTGNGQRVELWYLKNPGNPDGSRSVVLTLTGVAQHFATIDFYKDVHQTVPFGSSYKTTNTGILYALTLTDPTAATGQLHLMVASSTHADMEVGSGSTPPVTVSELTMNYPQELVAPFGRAEAQDKVPLGGSQDHTKTHGGGGSGPTAWMLVVLMPVQSMVYYRPFEELSGRDKIPGGTYTQLIGLNEDGVSLVENLYGFNNMYDVEVTPGTWLFDRATNTLYLHTSTGESPDAHDMISACRRIRVGSMETDFADEPLYYPILFGDSIPEFQDDASHSVAASIPIQGGTVQLQNSDGRFDSLVKAWLWRNRKVTMRHGGNFSTGYQLTYAEYEPIGSLFINDAAAADDKFEMKLRPIDSPDRALPNETYLDAYPSTIDLFENQQLRQQYMPVILGRCFDVPLVYLYTDGGERFAAGYGTDVPIITQVRAIDRLTGAKTVLTPVTHYVVNSMQDIRIYGYSRVTYDIFADMEESTASTTGKFGSMAKKVLMLGDVEESAMDLATFTEADVDAPFVLGLYIPGGDFPSMMTQQALSELCTSVMGRVYLDIDGLWRAQVWDPSIDASSVPQFNADEDFSQWEPIAKLESIVKGVRIRHSFHVGKQTSREYFDNDLSVQYRQATKDNLIIKTALTSAEDANLMVHRYMAKLANLTTVVKITERSAQMMGMLAWDKFLLTRNRAPSLTGRFDEEPFEVLQITKKYAPYANVEALIGDISGLRVRLRRWAPSTVVNDYSASTEEEQRNYAYWADADGLVEGDPEKTSYWW